MVKTREHRAAERTAFLHSYRTSAEVWRGDHADGSAAYVFRHATGKHSGVGFAGTAGRPAYHYSFRDLDAATRYGAAFIAGREAHGQAVRQRREEQAKRAPGPLDGRDGAIVAIRAALQRRSGKTWSVTGGRGTGWGWIRIDAPPRECVYAWDDEDGSTAGTGSVMSGPRRRELAQLLGLERVHAQGESIAASSDYYREYVDRAEGRTPSVVGRPYWD